MNPPQRKKRPQPERERPVRSWSTLFGANGEARPAGSKPTPHMPAAEVKRDPSDANRALTDSVGLGYRVIDEYLRQGQQVAQSFNPASFAAAGFNPAMFGAAGFNPAAFGGGAPSPDEMNQMSQRLMQYGWDFAGLWFEMWSKMTAASVPTGPFGPRQAERTAAANHAAPTGATESAGVAPAGVAANSGTRERVVVSVSCQRPTTTALDVRPNEGATLMVYALRAEGHDAPPIRDVAMERQPDGTLSLRVNIGPEQPPGIYNAMILDAATNLPRGTLSVVVSGSGDGGTI